MVNIQNELQRLASFALKVGLIEPSDLVYSVNQALEILGLDDFTGQVDVEKAPESPILVLSNILDWAFENGRIEGNTAVYRDLFDSKLMNAFTPRPSQVIASFETLYEQSPQQATDWYYKHSQDTNYIRMDRIAKNRQWKSNTEYGPLDITINLSKPEKDPKAIVAARNMPSSGYPKCLLCKENEGYAGRLNHPGRHSHRIIPIELTEEKWYLQYSPYVYYNEHSIILKGTHDPMQIGRKTFRRLLEFVDKFPHYFIGSNADLPIVGGSILSHDHFQGGRYTFAMEKAPIQKTFKLTDFVDVEAGIVKWPMSVVRLRHKNMDVLVDAAEKVFNVWKEYSDQTVDIKAYSDDERHNTVTPIARFNSGKFEMDIVLRNNRTSDQHPLGIFHPHEDVHHIKKENIGLIEVMGLAVLPARLEKELNELAKVWMGQTSDVDLSLHMTWLEALKASNDPKTLDEAFEVLKVETGKKFKRVLEDAGVFKDDLKGQDAFDKFIEKL